MKHWQCEFSGSWTQSAGAVLMVDFCLSLAADFTFDQVLSNGGASGG